MREPRRVLLVSPVGTIGGGEEVLLALVRHLPAFGWAADLVSLRPGPLTEAAREAGAAFVAEGQPHRMRDLGRVRATRRWLADLVNERRPAIVHSNHMAHLYAHGPAHAGGAKEVWHQHDYPHRVDWADRLNRLIPADHIIFTTAFVRSGYPILARRFANTIVPPSAPDMSGPSADVDSLRAKFSLPADATIFLTATRLQPHKGHATLLHAASTALAAEPSAVFCITGEPTDPTQSAYLTSLRATAARLHIDHAVRFIGRVSDADLVGLYSVSRALVHPATTEGFGLALVNAMRAGLPVIAADAAGPLEVLEAGKLGTLVPRGDALALATAIIDTIRQPPDVSSIAKIASTRFSPARMAGEVAAVYDAVVGKGAA